MDVELVTDEISEDEIYGVDDYSEDYLNYVGERCGICMDVVIDRGVLDCCQHWFCFACIDNWATITSLCPLCQNEFQLITCVPVYDTVGGNKTDDETNPRDDEWFIEGKTNTLSFPSYYIDENAVVCLDGDDCNIRSRSVAIEEDSDIDTSIACDSCDKWYHAYCVGFDPEGTCDTSWLCPRCTVVKDPETADRVSIIRKNYENSLEITGGDFQADSSFSGRVSVSVADDGETAVVISLIEGNQDSVELGESTVGCSNAMENTFLSSSTSNIPNSEAPPGYTNSLEPNLCQQEMGLALPQDNGYTSSHSLSPAELKVSVDDAVKRAQRHLDNKMTDTGLGLDVGLSMGSEAPDNSSAEDHKAGSLEPNNSSEVLLPAEDVMCNEMEASIQSMTRDEKETMNGTSGAKRKHEDSRYADDGEREVHNDAKSSRKKIKAERDCKLSSLTDQTAVSSLDDSNKVSSRSNLRGSTYKSTSEKEYGTTDIMEIIQETDRRSLKQLKHRNSSDRSPSEKESAAGLRLKKIMRRVGDNKDSFELVQELRKKIRETVRNKSSKELGQKVFDPELLNAFRAALTGPGDENRKPTVDVKAKRSLLEKGKVRESLTKKIYGTGGKRKRAWTRECEVEFWKHRCMKTSKPEKIQMLKSVLDLLKDNSDCMDKMPGNEQEAKGSILSRLYLADSSVLPRKNDIQPVSALNSVSTPEQEKHDGLTEHASTLRPNNQSNRNPQKHNTYAQVIVPPLESKETKKITKGMRSETAPSDAQPKKHLKGSPSEKGMTSKPDMINGDKRKWALELLARKTASSGKNMQEKEEDNKILKGNYTLLAQLPKEMRPVLAPSRHNKISVSVRQVQLYRLTEHFLKKANLPVVSQSAETELAVADAVNIEKGIADRSNSKLVYLNLCSQELLRRSDDVNNDRAKEANPCSTSECHSDRASKETNKCSLDLEVDEALKKAGLMSDSPPDSPDHPTEDIHYKVGSVEDSEDEGPDNVIEVDSHPDLDIYGDFEYSLEDDDFIGAGALHISKLEAEEPKMKVLFSSLKFEASSGIGDPPDHELGVEALGSPLDLLGAQNKTSIEDTTVDSGGNEYLVRNSSDDNDEDAECEELYGPDKESIIEKYPEIASVTPFKLTVNNELHGENEDYRSKNSGRSSEEDHTGNLEAVTDESKQLPSDSEKREYALKKEKTSKCDTKQSEMVMKKVEAYIKEHIRPLCKSGVITVEQYRWAVGKTTEKVMKYHSKEKNANFLIKEGEKVKKLAEQYVETAQKTKT